MRYLLALFLSISTIHASETFNSPLTGPEQSIKDSSARFWPASISFTTDGNGVSMPIGNELINIGRGVIPGKKNIKPFGRTVSNVNNTMVDIWDVGGTYVFPASPIQMQVVSSSASDASAGVGIRTIEILYLDTNYNEVSTIVTLNGTTPVLTVPTNILRINDVHTLTAGSTAQAVGNISIQSVGGGVTYSQITAGRNTPFQTIYTVPAGKTLYITALHGGARATASGHVEEVSLRATCTLEGQLTPGIFQSKEIASVSDTSEYIPFTIPIKIAGMSDVKGSCMSDASNANATCLLHYEGWLE